MEQQVLLDTMWTLIAACLVFLMQAGFAMLETGFTRQPVGAVSVHGVCGAFGTIAVGLFASPRLIDAAGVVSPGLFYGGGFSQLGVQALGVVAVAAWALGASAIVFGLIKATVGLRVTAEEEIEGLDIGEHGMWGYPETFLGTDVVPTSEIVEKVRREVKERSVEAEPALVVEPT